MAMWSSFLLGCNSASVVLSKYEKLGDVKGGVVFVSFGL